MDALSLSSDLSSSAVNAQIGVDVLRSVQNLDKTAMAELFGSIGLGTAIDVRA